MTDPVPEFVLDSFALLAFFRAEPAAQKVRELIRRADAGEVRLAMTSVNLGEVVYRTIREKGIDRADEIIARIQEFAIDIVDVDQILALAAAHVKGSYKISYADCLATALAQRLEATLVTGDADFRQLEDMITIEWLPQKELS